MMVFASLVAVSPAQAQVLSDGAQGPAALRLTAPGTPPASRPTSAPRPQPRILRQDEDWSLLEDPSLRTDPLDRLRYVPLVPDGSVWLSTAVNAHVSLRMYEDELFGGNPGADVTYNTRLNVHAAITFGDRMRLYGALKHGDRLDSAFPVAPPNRDRLDLHQAFVELNVGDAFGGIPGDAFVRVGRQDLHYGAGRLIAARLGPNVRSDFDGILARAQIGKTVADAFLFRGVTDGPDVFDNRVDRAETLWGAYATTPLQGFNLDLIYIGQRRERSPYAFAATPLDEERHTIGARLWSAGPPGGWRVDVEGEYQFGAARASDNRDYTISAWSVSGAVGWSAPEAPLAPGAGVEFGLTSGDGDPADGSIGTFRAPAPPGRYFGEANPLGPGNLAGFRPYLDVHPIAPLRLRAKATFFWRMREGDGVYTLAPSVLRRAGGEARYVGAEPGVEAELTLSPNLTLTAFLTRLIVGDYLRDNPPARDITYAEATLAFSF